MRYERFSPLVADVNMLNFAENEVSSDRRRQGKRSVKNAECWSYTDVQVSRFAAEVPKNRNLPFSASIQRSHFR
jgi:hypothetical protein